ncbi:MAG TPA: hypothetical protein VJR89_38260 [Polyangiales bacterium]|nr:hypothetical protein [Polyangiales bacterium]
MRFVVVAVMLAACSGAETSKSTAKSPPRRTPRVDVDAGETCPSFDDRYVEAYKACDVDADCEAVAVQLNCSGTKAVYGVAIDLREDFDRCAPTDYPKCNAQPLPTRAEDQRPSAKADASDVHARCIEGMCQTRIEERECGSNGTVCRAGELCVALLNDAGLMEYTCTPNPCQGELSCACAEPVCKLRSDALRTCTFDRVEDSDVFCKTVPR